ncbi:RNaseH domain-containing protein [Parafrankia sp. FMc6]|uniref:RNaseH domain-containing protein n=1 Tax=Parafrankia soli TaxID=2599596 RepID=UPI0034D726D3
MNPAAIFNLVAAWVRAQKGTPEQIAMVLSQLHANDLTWSPVHLDLSSRAERDRAMRLLPMEIAARLSRPEAGCPHRELHFRRCPSPQGAEVMSWPPEGVAEKKPFSVRIRITAQTLPTSRELLVYLSFGVRRWMPVQGRIATDHGHSVYLAPTVPYLPELGNSRHFGIAKIKRVKGKNVNGESGYAPRWDDALARVLDQAGCFDGLPDPVKLTDSPLDFLQRHDNAAALVYSTGMLDSEKVSAGLSLADREPLRTWVGNELAPHLHPVAPLSRAKRTVYKSLGGITEGAIAAEYLKDVVGPRLTVELLTGTDHATRYALDRLAMRLGAPMPSVEQLREGETLLDLGPVTVGIRRQEAPTIRADLDRDGHTAQAAVEARVEQVAEMVGPAAHPTVTLVEIAHPDAYQGRRRGDDPKFAIRHGLLRTGRLSQFVTPVAEPKRPARTPEGREPSDPNRERFSAAVDELFRQLGVRPRPLPGPVPGTLPRQPALLALWMIRQNNGSGPWGVARQVPVAVLADPTGQHVQVRAPKVPWQELRGGLIEIGSRYAYADLKCGPDDVVRFVKEVVAEAVEAFPDTLLLTHAQNLRGVWKTLTNEHLQLDTLGFGAGEPKPISTFPGLRHVRVRTAEGGETPECYGVRDEGTGQPKGLWSFLLPRLYGSTGGKPSTATGAVKGVSKLVSAELSGKLVAPRLKAQVWNAQFIELLVAGAQDGDEPEHWAALAHDLREAAPYVRDTTVLPWPLHLAQQLEEYLLPAKIGDLDESEPTEQS